MATKEEMEQNIQELRRKLKKAPSHLKQPIRDDLASAVRWWRICWPLTVVGGREC